MNSALLAVIGPENIISVFRAAGADIFPATSGREAAGILSKLGRSTESGGKRYAVAILLENLRAEIPDAEFEKLTSGGPPAVLVVSGAVSGASIKDGAKGRGPALRRLGKLSEKAIGMDIVPKE